VKSVYVLAGLALLLAGGAALWLAFPAGEPPSEAAAAPQSAAPPAGPAAEPLLAERPQVDARSALEAQDSHRTAEIPRKERPRSVEPASGALELEVAWASASRVDAGIPLGVFALGSSQPHVLRAEVATTGDGRARFDALPPGRVRIECGLGAHLETTVVSGETRTERLVLDDGYALSGRTVDAAGRVVSNATLWMLRPGSRDSLRVGESDSNGSFRLPGVAAGQRLFARSFENSPSVPVTLGGPETARIELRLSLGAAGATVSGQVLDSDEEPLVGAAVALESTGLVGGEPPPRALAVTDREGRFRLVGCESGPTRLLVLHEDAVPFDQAITALPRPRNEHILRLTGGTLVGGTVYGSDGKPAAGVPLRLSSSHAWLARETRSDARGQFVLRGVPPGTARITVGSATQVVEIPRESAFTWNPRLRAASGN